MAIIFHPDVPPNNQAGIAHITLFVIIGVVYLIITITYMLIRNVTKDFKCLKVIWLVDIAYLVAGSLYYVGIHFLSSVLQTVLLGTSILVYRFIPFFISKYYQSNLAKEHQTTEAKLQLVPEWILAAESLTSLVVFNALYTVLFNSVFSAIYSGQPQNDLCNSGQIYAVLVLWILFVLMYMFILYYTMNIQYCGNCSVNTHCVTSNFIAFLPLVAFGMYLLTSNSIFPILLVCSGANAPLATIFLKIIVLIVVITVIVLLLVYRCMSKTRQEKLLPRALYQHLHPEPDEQVNELPLESVNIDEENKEIIQIPN